MTQKIKSLIIDAVLFALAGVFAHAEPKPVAPTPPLGWNSFDSYGVYLHEKAAMENLEAMGKQLWPYGYEYFVIDNGWFGEYKLKPGTLYPLEKHASDVRINEHGHVVPSLAYFPGGLKPIIDRCHELGLKFGILRSDPDMLTCNQNGVMGKRISFENGLDVWKTPEKGGKNLGWVGVFNRTDRLKTFTLTPTSIGLDVGATVYNIWKGRKKYKVYSASPVEIDINLDGVLFLRYE